MYFFCFLEIGSWESVNHSALGHLEIPPLVQVILRQYNPNSRTQLWQHHRNGTDSTLHHRRRLGIQGRAPNSGTAANPERNLIQTWKIEVASSLTCVSQFTASQVQASKQALWLVLSTVCRIPSWDLPFLPFQPGRGPHTLVN